MMYEQLAFDFGIVEETTEFTGWEFADLKRWVKSLKLGFEEATDVLKRQVMRIGTKKTRIDVYLGNYAPSHMGGARHVSIGCEDTRGGYSGFCGGYDTLESAERIIRLYAEKYGLV